MVIDTFSWQMASALWVSSVLLFLLVDLGVLYHEEKAKGTLGE